MKTKNNQKRMNLQNKAAFHTEFVSVTLQIQSELYRTGFAPPASCYDIA